jgi:peptidoglycan/LPS O-acetylase OafA/YrhL
VVNWQGLWRLWPDVNTAALPLYAGWMGVPLFFVISGLCIHLSYQKQLDHHQKSWWLFYVRRFCRLYPPYLLVFCVVALLAILAKHTISPFSLISHIGLFQNINVATIYDLNAALWSVAVEWQLYLLYPLILVITRLIGWQFSLTLAAGLEMLLNSWPDFANLGLCSPLPFVVLHSAFAYWFSWSLGAALAEGYRAQRPLMTERWQLPLWAVFTLVALFFKPLYPLAFLFMALFSGSVIARQLWGNATGHLALTKATKPLTVGGASGWKPAITHTLQAHFSWIGQISYSVYLVHMPILGLWPWLMRHHSQLQWWGPSTAFYIGLMLWPVTLLIAYGVFIGVEMPSMRLGKWLTR